MEKRPHLHLGVAAIENGAFGLPPITVANFQLFWRPDSFKILIPSFDLPSLANYVLINSRKYSVRDFREKNRKVNIENSSIATVYVKETVS